MIFDNIKNRKDYANISPRIDDALTYLSETDFSILESGRYDIDGDKLFALVQEYSTIPLEEGRWECHRKYIDIQFVIAGVEMMGFGVVSEMDVAAEYNADNDIEFLKGVGNMVAVGKNFFCLFFPHDAHMPKLSSGKVPEAVKKVVIKVRID